jgi:deoxyribose-phosphate aldolase
MRSKYSYKDIMHYVDLTCLKDEVIKEDIDALVAEAELYQVAAICVWPQHLDWIPKECTIAKATVVNFPNGAEPLEEVLKKIDEIIQKHPGTEIDYVFPYQQYWQGDKAMALQHCQSVIKYCEEQHITLKIILETGVIQNLVHLQTLASQLIDMGATMLKTSTGKTPIGATHEAVKALSITIYNHTHDCGLKISGGIKFYSEVLDYLDLVLSIISEKPHPSWIRFGCSQLINDL